MIRNPDLNPNVHMELTKKTEAWRTLCIKPADLLLANCLPHTSRGQSTENFKFDSSHSSKPFSSNNRYSANESHTNSFTNSTEVSYDKQLEMVESKLYEISKIKNQLYTSFTHKKETLRIREKELIKKEQELKNKQFAFEEERNKWCIHISLKLKELKIKEIELENTKSSWNSQMEKCEKIEKAFEKLQEEAEIKNKRLEGDEISLKKREQEVWENEERLAMKIEDVAGYEQRVIEFDYGLRKKEEDLDKIAGIIAEEKRDIEKSLDMFENIKEQLRYEDKRVKAQREINAKKAGILKEEKKKLRNWQKILKLEEKMQNSSKYENSDMGRRMCPLGAIRKSASKPARLCKKIDLSYSREQPLELRYELSESSEGLEFQEFSVRTSEEL